MDTVTLLQIIFLLQDLIRVFISSNLEEQSTIEKRAWGKIFVHQNNKWVLVCNLLELDNYKSEFSFINTQTASTTFWKVFGHQLLAFWHTSG